MESEVNLIQEIDWTLVAYIGVPIATFVIGWFMGRRGSSAASAARIVRALNNISSKLDTDSKD